MNGKREYSLDVLKFIGIIIIIFHHYQQMTGTYFERMINFYGGKFNWAYVVDLFFILSGYFTYKYVENINEKNRFFVFFEGKYFRFFPMIFLSGVVCLILDWVYYVKILGQSFPHSVWGTATGLTGSSFWFKCSNCFIMLNSAMWYISVLLLCYVFFFFGTYVAKRWKISPYTMYAVIICVGIIMNAICTTYKICIPFFTIDIGRGLCGFFLGVLFRHFLEKYPIHHKHITWITAGGLLGFLVILYVKRTEYFSDLWYVLCFLIYPAIILIFKSKPAERIFFDEKLKYLGGIAFNAYIWHVAVLRFLLIVINLKAVNLKSITAMVLMTCIIFLIGGISYFFIEKPVEKKIREWLLNK